MSSASDVGLTDGTSDTDMEVLEEQVGLRYGNVVDQLRV